LSGKTMFIKFYAPWCGHCKDMAVAWKQLEEDYSESETFMVGNVNCASRKGKELCKGNKIESFPTILLGQNPEDLEIYHGDRSYYAMKQFAKMFFVEKCGPFRLDLCDEHNTTRLKKFMTMSAEKLEMKQKLADSKMRIAMPVLERCKAYKTGVTDRHELNRMTGGIDTGKYDSLTNPKRMTAEETEELNKQQKKAAEAEKAADLEFEQQEAAHKKATEGSST